MKMSNTRTIVLKRTRLKNIYSVFEGETTTKTVEGTEKQIQSFTMAKFLSDNPLKEVDSSIMYMFDNAFTVDGTLMTPAAQYPHVSKLKYHQPGRLLVLEDDASRFIDKYRVMKLIDALPTLIGSDISDIRKAEDLIRGYHNYKRAEEQKQGGLGYRVNKLLKRLTKSDPEWYKPFKGKIDREILENILKSFPNDMDDNRITPDCKLNIVLTDPSMTDEEVRYALAHPEEFDVLAGIEKITDFGVYKEAELLGPPMIIYHEERSQTESSKNRPTLGELMKHEFYEENIFTREARPLVSTSSYTSRIKAMLTSPVEVSFRKDRGEVFFTVGEQKVSYSQAIQLVGKGKKGVSVNGAKHYEAIDQKSYRSKVRYFKFAQENAKGVVGVSVFTVRTDLSKYFPSPKDLRSFEGKLNREYMARKLYRKLFREKVYRDARILEKTKGVQINSIVLSDIKVNTHLIDNLITIGTDPLGECLLAATYLT